MGASLIAACGVGISLGLRESLISGHISPLRVRVGARFARTHDRVAWW